MKILAIDPGLKTTGWAMYHENEIRCDKLESGNLRGPDRLEFFYDELRNLIDGTHIFILEGYSYGSKGAAAYQLGELGGIIRLILAKSDIDQMGIMTPSQIKILATGKGNTSKNAVLAAAIRRLGYEGCDDNEADARWLLEGALHYWDVHMKTQLPKTHLRGIDKIF